MFLNDCNFPVYHLFNPYKQAKTVEDLQKLGATENTVAVELKKVNELQSIASKNFRLVCEIWHGPLRVAFR